MRREKWHFLQRVVVGHEIVEVEFEEGGLQNPAIWALWKAYQRAFFLYSLDRVTKLDMVVMRKIDEESLEVDVYFNRIDVLFP